MQDTESEQQILRLLYHEKFDLEEARDADLQQWARTENVEEAALTQIVGSLLSRELISPTGKLPSCRLTDKGVFWVEDSGLAPAHSATHHFAVRLSILEALSLYASSREALENKETLADRATISMVDCRRNLPILEDAGWARTTPDGRIEITVKGLQTLHEWRRDVRASVASNLRQA